MLMNGQQQLQTTSTKFDSSSTTTILSPSSSSSSSSPNISSSAASNTMTNSITNGQLIDLNYSQHHQQQQHLAAVYKSFLSGGAHQYVTALNPTVSRLGNSSSPPQQATTAATILGSHAYLHHHSLTAALTAAHVPPPPLSAQPHLISSQPDQQQDHQHLFDYMHQLLEEKEKLKELFHEPFNILLPLSARLIDEEINRIRTDLFQLGTKDALNLPEPVGQVQQMTEKLYVPVKDHPDFNFVGRILGPRGMTAKQLEQETGCKIMVRGKGSMRDKAKEEQMKGKPNWEHLNDDLHVLITVEDTKNRADIKLKRAVDEIKKLLVPSPEGEDELKKKQLMELAIINGTYRDSTKLQQQQQQQKAATLSQILIPTAAASQNPSAAAAVFASLAAASLANRSPPSTQAAASPLGQPLIISPRIATAAAPTAAHQAAAINAADPTNGFIYATHIPFYSTAQTAAAAAAAASQHHTTADLGLLDYPTAVAAGLDFSQAGPIKAQRFATVTGATSVRAHPYTRVALS